MYHLDPPPNLLAQLLHRNRLDLEALDVKCSNLQDFLREFLLQPRNLLQDP